MRIFEVYINSEAFDYLKKTIELGLDFNAFNEKINADFGIINFCETVADFENLVKEFHTEFELILEEDRAEYGDFQTPSSLAERTCDLLKRQNIAPKICLEPTCGKGSFILASLKSFQSLEQIFGIEIYKPYVWETKFGVIQYFLTNSNHTK